MIAKAFYAITGIYFYVFLCFFKSLLQVLEPIQQTVEIVNGAEISKLCLLFIYPKQQKYSIFSFADIAHQQIQLFFFFGLVNQNVSVTVDDKIQGHRADKLTTSYIP